MSDGVHSTGRGGVGNIGKDPGATYVDPAIVRKGTDVVNPRALSGRGGAGNMPTSPPRQPSEAPNAAMEKTTTTSSETPEPPQITAPPAAVLPGTSEIDVPETATVRAKDNFHCGRGGSGNEHRREYGGHSAPRPEGEKEPKEPKPLLQKVKATIGM